MLAFLSYSSHHKTSRAHRCTWSGHHCPSSTRSAIYITSWHPRCGLHSNTNLRLLILIPISNAGNIFHSIDFGVHLIIDGCHWNRRQLDRQHDLLAVPPTEYTDSAHSQTLLDNGPHSRVWGGWRPSWRGWPCDQETGPLRDLPPAL